MSESVITGVPIASFFQQHCEREKHIVLLFCIVLIFDQAVTKSVVFINTCAQAKLLNMRHFTLEVKPLSTF